MAFATEVRALALKMTGLLRTETNLCFLVLFYVVGFYVQCLDLNSVRNINAVQNKDDRFPVLESDLSGL
jgi:hypothetical protein